MSEASRSFRMLARMPDMIIRNRDTGNGIQVFAVRY